MARINVDQTIEGSQRMVEPQDALGTCHAQAIGHAVMLWARIANERRRGRINGLSDGVLEKFAGWEGPPGVFAAAARRILATEAGELHDWPGLFGNYETEREHKADAMRAKRAATKKAEQVNKKHSGERVPENFPERDRNVPNLFPPKGPVLSRPNQHPRRPARAGAAAPRRVPIHAEPPVGPPSLPCFDGAAERNTREWEQQRKQSSHPAVDGPGARMDDGPNG
jgi:hypothetical protein